MAYLAYLWIPYDNYDLVRHYERFDLISHFSFDEVFNLLDLRFFFDVYMWILSHLKLPKEFVPFSVIFMTYFLLFTSYKKFVDFQLGPDGQYRYVSFKNLMLIGMLLLILQIRFIDSASGMRNYIAFSFFVYGSTVYYIEKKIFVPAISFLLASLFHIAALPIVFLFILVNLVPLEKIYRVVFVTGLVLLLTGQMNTIFIVVMNLLKPTLQAHGLYIDAYMSTDGAYGGDYYAHMNTKTYILEKFIFPMPFYLAGIYLYFVKNITFGKMKSFFYIFFSFIVLVSLSRTMFMRYLYLFDFLFIFLLILELREKRGNKYRKIFLYILTLAMLTGSLGGFYANRGTYAPSWGKILYVPAPIMLLRGVEPNEYIHRGE